MDYWCNVATSSAQQDLINVSGAPLRPKGLSTGVQLAARSGPIFVNSGIGWMRLHVMGMASGKWFSWVLGWICLSLTGKQCVGLEESPSGLKNTLSNSENAASWCSRQVCESWGPCEYNDRPKSALWVGALRLRVAIGHQTGAAHEHPAQLSPAVPFAQDVWMHLASGFGL